MWKHDAKKRQYMFVCLICPYMISREVVSVSNKTLLLFDLCKYTNN